MASEGSVGGHLVPCFWPVASSTCGGGGACCRDCLPSGSTEIQAIKKTERGTGQDVVPNSVYPSYLLPLAKPKFLKKFPKALQIAPLLRAQASRT